MSTTDNNFLFWATLVLAIFAAINKWGETRLSENYKNNLISWLKGHYKNSWPIYFRQLFDTTFGVRTVQIFNIRQFALPSIFRSLIASFAAVTLLYIYFNFVAGISQHNNRMGGTLNYSKALFIGMFLNSIPDYLSLFQTRWILQHLSRTKSFYRQFRLLLLDAFLTGLIIWCFIALYNVLIEDKTIAVTVMELIGGYSTYSLFFYSTFITSLWAWLFCISAWLMRFFPKNFIIKVFNIEKNPLTPITFVSSVFLLIFTLITTQMLRDDNQLELSVFDQLMCKSFPISTCDDVIRFSKNEDKAFAFVLENCSKGIRNTCNYFGEKFNDPIDIKFDKVKAIRLFKRACDFEDVRGCYNLAWHYEIGVDLPKNLATAEKLYKKACRGDFLNGCLALGLNYYQNSNDESAVEAFKQACNLGSMVGCSLQGSHYSHGLGVTQDDVKATKLFKQACESDELLGCIFLSWHYQEGRGFTKSIDTKNRLLDKACAKDNWEFCLSVGRKYLLGSHFPQDKKKAAELFQYVCNADLNSMIACEELGELYRDGSGVVKDYAEAAKLFEQACNEYHYFGCASLGYMYKYGQGVEKDEDKAFDLLQRHCGIFTTTGDGCLTRYRPEHKTKELSPLDSKKAKSNEQECKRGDFDACVDLGKFYRDVFGAAYDPTKAVELFAVACNANNDNGCLNLGKAYDMGNGVAMNPAKAFELYDLACDSYNMEGCLNLGYAYRYGQFIEKNIDKAIDLFEMTCNAGYVNGCSTLAWQYRNGEGVIQDDVKAAELFQLACYDYNSTACLNLANFYQKGIGVVQDDFEAMELFKIACAGDNLNGCLNVAWQYRSGRGTVQNDFEASKIFQRICDEGGVLGCLALSWQYEDGRGLPQDKIKAAKLAQYACNLGFPSHECFPSN